MNKNVCAIIITFNPSIELFEKLILSLSKQCFLIVVDNCSSQECIDSILDLSNVHHFILLPLSENYGIAKAQNEGIHYIEKNISSVEYLIFFDQDSIPDSDLIDILYREYIELEKSNNIAMIGPSLYDSRSNTFHGFHFLKNFSYFHILPAKMKNDTIECFSVNSSGSFSSLKIFKQVGFYNEDLFIDHVETEWCFRAKYLGYKFFGTKKTKIDHCMGDDVLEYNLFGKKTVLPYRNPLRHQYLFRNSFFLLKKSFVPIIWKFYCLLKLSYTFIIFGFFTVESSRQRKAMINGIKDGVRGKTGKLEEY